MTAVVRVWTDDAARRQEFVWLGPVSSPLPFSARGQAWAAGLVLVPVFSVAAYVVTPFLGLLPAPAWGLVLLRLGLSLAVGSGAAVWLIRRVGGSITPTRPVRHHVAVLACEVDTPREANATERVVQLEPGVWVEDRAEGRQVHAVTVPAFIGRHGGTEDGDIEDVAGRDVEGVA